MRARSARHERHGAVSELRALAVCHEHYCSRQQDGTTTVGMLLKIHGAHLEVFKVHVGETNYVITGRCKGEVDLIVFREVFGVSCGAGACSACLAAAQQKVSVNPSSR